MEVLLDFGDVSNWIQEGGQASAGTSSSAFRMASAENMLISPPRRVRALISCLQGAEDLREPHLRVHRPRETDRQVRAGEGGVPAGRGVIFTKNYGCGLVFLQEGHGGSAPLHPGQGPHQGKPAVKETVDGARELGATFKGKIEATTAPAAGPVLPPAEVHAVIDLIVNSRRWPRGPARTPTLRRSSGSPASRSPTSTPTLRRRVPLQGRQNGARAAPQGRRRCVPADLHGGAPAVVQAGVLCKEEYRKAVQAAPRRPRRGL